ncbi:MAG: MmcQ/YjbR family DNA-binding protein [Bacilli bacterium]|nr:MmcQ/YjbR family DNA-binding protein [Bacilli bacterium]
MIEKEVFKKAKIDINKLVDYGFKKEKDYYIYNKKIMNTFNVEIIVKDDKLTGKIIDTELDEEYTDFRVEKNTGEFVNTIREEYRKILEDIKNNCTLEKKFIYDQTNKVTKYIYDKYKVKPEFLWEKYDDYGIFRNKNNKKWFSIIMNVDKSKIEKGTGEIEIINVKVEENMLKELLKQKGFYEAYHMNKKYWLTIVLDDTVDDEIIFSLIDNSFDLVNK